MILNTLKSREKKPLHRLKLSEKASNPTTLLFCYSKINANPKNYGKSINEATLEEHRL